MTSPPAAPLVGSSVLRGRLQPRLLGCGRADRACPSLVQTRGRALWTAVPGAGTAEGRQRFLVTAAPGHSAGDDVHRRHQTPGFEFGLSQSWGQG